MFVDQPLAALGRLQFKAVAREPGDQRGASVFPEIRRAHQLAARELRDRTRRVDFRKGAEPALMQEVNGTRREAIIPAWRVGQSLGLERDAPGSFERDTKHLADSGVGPADPTQR